MPLNEILRELSVTSFNEIISLTGEIVALITPLGRVSIQWFDSSAVETALNCSFVRVKENERFSCA